MLGLSMNSDLTLGFHFLQELVAIRRFLLAQFSSFAVSGRDMYDDVMSTMAMLSTGCERFVLFDLMFYDNKYI